MMALAGLPTYMPRPCRRWQARTVAAVRCRGACRLNRLTAASHCWDSRATRPAHGGNGMPTAPVVTADACATAIPGDESVAGPCTSTRHMRTSRGWSSVGKSTARGFQEEAQVACVGPAGSEAPRRHAMCGKGRCAVPGSAVQLDRPGPRWLKLSTACGVLATGRLLPSLSQTRQSAREVRPTVKALLALALAARFQPSTSPQVIETSPARSAGRLRCFLP